MSGHAPGTSFEPHAWDSAGGRQSNSASAQTTGDPGADLRSLRWPETAERFNTDMLNMMALRAASPPSEQALGGRVRCHIRVRKTEPVGVKTDGLAKSEAYGSMT